jgi:hypothetical protein
VAGAVSPTLCPPFSVVKGTEQLTMADYNQDRGVGQPAPLGVEPLDDLHTAQPERGLEPG